MSMRIVSMSLENVDEYEADIRRRNLLHLKREHSRLFDASAIAKRFRLTDTTSGEGASGSRKEKEGIHPSSDRLDDYGCPNEQGSRVGGNPGNCICGELVGPTGNGGLANIFQNTHFVKTLKFKLLDVPHRCSSVTGADDAGSGPSEVPYSGGIEGEVQDDSLKDDGGRLESPTVQSPIVHCTSDDEASDDIGHVCQVETPAINYVHQQGSDDRPLKMRHTVTSQLFSGQDSPETVGSEPFQVSFSGGIEAEVQDDGGIVAETVGSPAVQSPIVRRMSDADADGACDGIGNMCQAETLANSKVHELGRDDCPPRMCHTVTSQLFSDQDSPGTGHQVHANLDVQFSKDGAGNLGHDSCGDDAGSHLSEKDKHLSSNQGQSVEESMVERQPVPTVVEYCAINYDRMETICRKSFQSPVRHYSMRPRSREKKEQYSSPQPVRHYSMRPRCREKKEQYSSPQPVRHYSMRPRCSEKKKHYSSPRTLGGRRKLQWTLEEVKILEEGVHKLSGTNDKSMPWKEILKYGSDVFKSRTTVDLKDKWRNICKGKSKLG